MMKRRNNIIAIFLIAFYMLSMAHSLFHNHMHSLLTHAEVNHVEHACSSSSCHSQNSLDHSHDSKSESECNVQTQFVPTDQKPKIEIQSIDVFDHCFIVSAALPCESAHIAVEFEYHAYSYVLPSDPEILYHSLRAPPTQC